MHALVARARTLLIASCVGLAGTWGCESSDDARPDRDAATDAGPTKPPEDMRPRRDAAVDMKDPIATCRATDPDACPTGQRCAIYARRTPDATDFMFFEGCVEAGPVRALGDPCSPFGGLTQPYRVPGLADEVHVDTCGPGLFCAPDLTVRGLNTCQPSCRSMGVSGYEMSCRGEGAFCSGTQRYVQVCRKSDGCNPADPTSCGPGRGCYLRVGDDGESVLSVCFPVPDMPVADGASCIDSSGTYYINACTAGASCWGPVRTPPASWAIGDYLCRRSCDPSLGAGADAGDEDGGVGPDGCRAGEECVEFAGSGLDISNIDGNFGHCE
jgi:hypothetical protein